MEIIKNRLRYYDMTKAQTFIAEETDSAIIPDTCPDALQIVCSRGELYIQDKSCADGELRVSGSVCCRVNYLSAEGSRIYSSSLSVPFTFSEKTEKADSDDRNLIHTELISSSAYLVNPRKISARVRVQITRLDYKCCCTEYAEDIKTDEDEKIYCLRDTDSISIIKDIAEKRLVISDEIRLSGNSPDENSVILGKEVNWICDEAKIIPGKIMIKGRADIILTYCGEETSAVSKSKYAVPFSQIVECGGADEGNEVTVSFSPAREETDIFTSSDGITTMTFALAAVTECIVAENAEMKAVKDIYSARWEMKCRKANIASAPDNPEIVSTEVKEDIALDFQPEKIESVWIEGEKSILKKGDDKAGCWYYITLLYRTDDGELASAEKKVYAEGTVKGEAQEDCLCVGGYKNLSWSAEGGNAEIRFDAEIAVSRYGIGKRSLICDCETDKSKEKTPSRNASLIVKTTDISESVWNIAKAFGTSPAVVASANKVNQEDMLPAGRLILIPLVNR